MEKLNTFNSLFDCPVFSHDHAGIDDAFLKSYILNLRQIDKGRTVSNKNGWQSNLADLRSPELSEFFQILLKDFNYYFEQLGGDINTKEVMITNCWFNINEKNSFNWPHVHDGFASGVYYIEADKDTGDLIFTHPSALIDLQWPSNWFNKNSHYSCTTPTWKMPPESSRFYIFPSWLTHSVDMNTTDKTRISVALNTTIVDRKDK